MRVSILSPSRNSGGARYARQLSACLGARIISSNNTIQGLVHQATKDSDLVDIQFEYRSFGSHLRTLIQLPLLVLLLRRRVKVVVTIHGVLTYDSLERERFRLAKLMAFVASIKITESLAAKLVVHTEGMRKQLERYGAKNTTVIPHGTGPLSYTPQGQRRKNILFFGFLRPSKGIDSLIAAFRKISPSYEGLTLTIAGSVNDETERPYLTRIIDSSKDLTQDDRLILRTHFIDDETKGKLAKECGILVLPYTDRYVEVSGVLHDFAGYGMAAICSETPRFSELAQEVECLKVRPTTEEIAGSMETLLQSEETTEKLSRGLFAFAERTSWSHVAQMRSELYQRIAEES